MKLAQIMGLPIPEITFRKSKHTLYIIKRFDRTLSAHGNLMRIHQEDFCQASGLFSDQKYESEGGPSLEKCFGLVREYSIQPAVDIMHLLNWVIFNYLIGNADAHAKNLTFLITKQGPKLSPFYDILCTHVYPSLEQRYAMKIGGENRPKSTKKRHWERLGNHIHLNYKFLGSTIQGMIEKYDTAIGIVMRELPPSLDESEQKFISSVLQLVEKRKRELIEASG